MVTHDRYFLDKVCNKIIEIDQQSIFTYHGNYNYYLEKRQERIEAQTAEVEKAKNLLRTELEWMRRQPQARGTKAKYRIDAFYDLKDKASKRITDNSIKLNVKSSYIGSKIFDANNGDPLDPDSYGGIIIDGDTRIVWSDIDADMVYQDPDTGETVFKEGTYKVNAGGYDLTIECKAGSKPPDISAHFSLEASGAGITVAGTLISWDNVKSEDNVSIKDSLKEGIY